MRKCCQFVFPIVLMIAILSLNASAETKSVEVKFKALGFYDAIYSYSPPASTVTGSFFFDFEFSSPAGGFNFSPTNVNLIIAKGTSFETDFSRKVLGVGVQWDGKAFTRIQFWAGDYAFYYGGDDFFLRLFPEGGEHMKYSLWSALSYYVSYHIPRPEIIISDPITVSEMIGTWSSGIWYWDVAASEWTRMIPSTPTGDIAAGDFTGDGKADVASCWSNGLWYQDGATLDWAKVSSLAPTKVAAGDVNGDGRAEIIGTWSDGIWYWDVVASEWIKMSSGMPSGDISAGDFTGDDIADVASCWDSGLWFQDGASLDWTKVSNTAPTHVTAGDVTGDGRAEIIGAWSSGIWYWDVAASEWTRMIPSTPTGDIAAGDFTGDGKADVASCWSNGLWYQDGDTLDWTKVSNTAPTHVTAGDVTGN